MSECPQENRIRAGVEPVLKVAVALQRSSLAIDLVNRWCRVTTEQHPVAVLEYDSLRSWGAIK
jgi:hypothetical protein